MPLNTKNITPGSNRTVSNEGSIDLGQQTAMESPSLANSGVENGEVKAYEIKVENSTAPKIEPQVQSRVIHTSQGILNAIGTSVATPLVTTPLDRYNQTITENPGSRNFLQSLKDKPFKGSLLSMITSFFSNAVFFVSGPVFERYSAKTISPKFEGFVYPISILMASILDPIVLGPVYTVRTKMLSPGNKDKSIGTIIHEIVKSPNPTSQVYRGLPMNIGRNVIYVVPYYTIYHKALAYLNNDELSGIQRIVNATFVGSLTGSSICLFSYPPDVISRLQRSNNLGNEFYNKSAFEIGQLIIKEEGPMGFYKRGFKTVPLRMFCAGGVTGGTLAVIDMAYKQYQRSGLKKASVITIKNTTEAEFPEAYASRMLTSRIAQHANTISEGLSRQLTKRILVPAASGVDKAVQQGQRDIESGAKISRKLTNRFSESFLNRAKRGIDIGSSLEQQERKVEKFIDSMSNF